MQMDKVETEAENVGLNFLEGERIPHATHAHVSSTGTKYLQRHSPCLLTTAVLFLVPNDVIVTDVTGPQGG